MRIRSEGGGALMKGEARAFPGAGVSLGACGFGVGDGGPREGCRRCGIVLGGATVKEGGGALAGLRPNGGGLGGPGSGGLRRMSP